MFAPHRCKTYLVLPITIVFMLMAISADAQSSPDQTSSRRSLLLETQKPGEPLRPVRPPVFRKYFHSNAAVSPTAAFSLEVYDTGGAEPVSLALGDLNGDGWPDLAIANYCAISFMSCYQGTGSIAVFMNTEGGFSGPGVYSSGGAYTGGVAIADVSFDGKPDIIVFNSCSTSDPSCIPEGVMLGNGDGSLQPVEPFSGVIPAVATAPTNWISTPDLNGDGIADIVSTSGPESVNGTVYVQLSNLDGTYQPVVSYPSGGGYAISAIVVDVNGDGYSDIVVLNQCADAATCSSVGATGSIGVLINDGGGTFQPAVTFSTGGVGSISMTVADVNRDGKPDILVINQCNNQGICPSGHGTLGVLVNAASFTATSTTLTSSANPAKDHESVTLTAAVQPYSGTAPDGELVTFRNGNSVLGTVPLSAGVAALTMKRLAIGTLNITATYGFDGTYGSSIGSITQLVKAMRGWGTTLTLTANPNPAYDQPITFTATVTTRGGKIPDGELVTFFNGSTILGSSAITGGVATLTSALAPNTYQITAIYPGDNHYKSSTGSLTAQIYARQVGVDLSSSANVSTYGAPVTFSVVVYPVTEPHIAVTGTVTFAAGNVVIGTATLESPLPDAAFASFTTSTLDVGTYTITAVYNGDSNYGPATSNGVSLVVQ